MDTGKWTVQEEVEVVKSMGEITQNTSSRPGPERKLIRPQKDQVANCPRCNSTNTKFCYYNNYSLTQPRYFCKTCRRYWTAGGTLRNVPVGGGSRKNKKSSSSSIPTITAPAATPLTANFHDLNPSSISQPTLFQSQNPKLHHQINHDLNLSFPCMQNFHGVPQFLELGKVENSQRNDHHNMASTSSFSTLELLKNPYVSDLNGLYTSGFPFEEMKPLPTLNFSLEGLGNRYNQSSNNGVEENIGKLMFPFGGMKQQHSSTTTTTNQVDDDQSKEQPNSVAVGYWNGMLGEAGSW